MITKILDVRMCSVLRNMRIGRLLQFVANSPCARISMFLPYRTLQNLFVSFVKGI
ncbi:hypothetical protein Hanom_Chr01g00070621 [Helianthus anomalus]